MRARSEPAALVLAAIQHIVAKLGQGAFREQPFEVETKLVAFASSVDLRLGRLSIPQRHTLLFST